MRRRLYWIVGGFIATVTAAVLIFFVGAERSARLAATANGRWKDFHRTLPAELESLVRQNLPVGVDRQHAAVWLKQQGMEVEDCSVRAICAIAHYTRGSGFSIRQDELFQITFDDRDQLTRIQAESELTGP